MTLRLLTGVTAALLFFSCSNKSGTADQIVVGKIWTADPMQPWAEAMAITGDSIVSIGKAADVLRWQGGQTLVTRADSDALIVPGFIDTHTHFVEAGFTLASVQLRDARTKTEFIQRIAEFARTVPPGTWITGGVWDHENWGGELPDRNWIDAVTPHHPVWIMRLDGHMSLANSAALKAAGVTDRVTDVAGGSIVRDKTGRITGIFKDNARDLIDAAVPPPSPEMEDGALQAAMHFLAENGVTGAHSVFGFNKAFERAHRDKKMITRVYAGMKLEEWKDLKKKIDRDGRGDKWLKIGALKAFMDGALGSHTAAFFKPYLDSKDSGFFITPEDQIYRWAKSADSAGLQLMIHAIGDKAINRLLTIYDKIEKENGNRDRRPRIEHTQHIDPNDISRMASLHVIASMQPYHAIDDGRWAEKIIGPERCKTTYAFRSLMDAGVRVAFGSDWPVAPAIPLVGIYAAVTRRTLDDRHPEGWFPEQKITVDAALRAYTIDAAYASFDEKVKGSLEKGKLADFVILDKNLFRIAPEKILDVAVVKTVVGGQTVFERKP